jgi:hypothetical protein
VLRIGFVTATFVDPGGYCSSQGDLRIPTVPGTQGSILPRTMGKKVIKILLACLVLLVVVAGATAWKVLRVEEIPEQLEALDAQTEPRDIVIPGMSDQPDLVFAKLDGKTTVLLVVGFKGMDEGRLVHRALNRWTLPDTVQGYMIGDAAGFGFLREKLEKMIGFWGEEMRFPLYLDFEGSVTEAFKLPKGHHGLVVLGPDLDVLMRHSGPMEEAGIEGLREMLGASEPPPGPEAPTFEVGPLSNDTCAGKVCALAFLGEPVSGKDLPGEDDGKERSEEEMRELFRRPAYRMAMSIKRMEEFEKEVGAVVVGSLEDVEIADTWTRLEDSEQGRKAFEIADDETAFLVVDAEGRVAFRESGLIPSWKMSQATHVMGLKHRDHDHDRD